MFTVEVVTLGLTVFATGLVLYAIYNTRKARQSLDELHRTYRR